MTRTHPVTRRIFGTLFRLGKPSTRRIASELDVPIPMPDGALLLADRWAPEALSATTSSPAMPTVLVRTCYSRKAFWGFVARAYAERGFQTVVVNSRGTFGSGGGPFYPMHHEHNDGLAVLDWVRAQPWYTGSMVLAGASYLGYTQWAVAAEVPDDVVAMHPHLTSARLAQNFSTSGALELDAAARWSYFTARQELPGANARLALGLDRKQLDHALNTLPFKAIDERMIGASWPFYQDTITRLEDDPAWVPWNRAVDLHRVSVPASFVAGWYDPFLMDQLSDFAALRDAGTPARLTIGPWIHTGLGTSMASVQDTLEWSAIQTGHGRDPARAAVRVFVMGAHTWRDFETWPPPGSVSTPWYLGSDGRLGREPDATPASTPYRYDPADPTPSVGGRLLLTGAGRKNNGALEARDDVLTFTTDPLVSDATMVGDIDAEIWMTSSRPTWDLFVRLCDVDRRGRSFNVADGLIRVVEPDGGAMREPQRVRVRLSSTAQLFERGHRIRIQVSSGAHPRWARNLGTLDEQTGITDMFPADQVVFHDAAHPSVVHLPVLPSRPPNSY